MKFSQDTTGKGKLTIEFEEDDTKDEKAFVQRTFEALLFQVRLFKK